MEQQAPTISPVQVTASKYRIPIIIASVVVVLLIILIIFLLSRSNTTNNEAQQNNQVSQDNQETSNDSEGQGQLLQLIPNNTCADSLQFGNPSYAYIGNTKYSFSEEQKRWIESNCPNVKKNVSSAVTVNVDGVTWTYDMPNWIAPDNAPECIEPLEFSSPADISKATSILYPGQIRGTDYKTHGALRFDNSSNNSVTVRMPADAYLWKATKYDENGEVQYLIQFMSKCGIVYKFDHLLTLSDSLSNVTSLPTEQTTQGGLDLKDLTQFFKKGDVIATEVGFRNPKNVGFDFGVFDLRQKNQISQLDPNYISNHMDDAESASNAICWLDNLEGNDKNIKE